MAEPASKFAVNTYSYTMSTSAAHCMARLADRGYGVFELMMYPGHLWPSETGAAERKALREFVERRDLRIVSINMSNVDLNIAAASPEMRAYSLSLIGSFVELAGDLGAPGVVIGPGKANPLFGAPKNVLQGHFFRALDYLESLAVRSGTELWLENLPVCFIPDAHGLMKVLDEYGNDRIGFCYDVANGHYIGEDPNDGLRIVSKRLKLVHASDTTRGFYKHGPVGSGNVPFAGVPETLRALGHDELPVLEIISHNADADIDLSVQRLVELGWGA
jgi:L-ribulose-5-phosphate 3-epimerase